MLGIVGVSCTFCRCRPNVPVKAIEGDVQAPVPDTNSVKAAVSPTKMLRARFRIKQAKRLADGGSRTDHDRTHFFTS